MAQIYYTTQDINKTRDEPMYPPETNNIGRNITITDVYTLIKAKYAWQLFNFVALNLNNLFSDSSDDKIEVEEDKLFWFSVVIYDR